MSLTCNDVHKENDKKDLCPRVAPHERIYLGIIKILLIIRNFVKVTDFISRIKHVQSMTLANELIIFYIDMMSL